MKKKIAVFLLLILLIPNNIYALSLSCRSCVLMDMDSGRVLYEKDKDNPRLIASITKIMTAILAIENGKLDEVIEVGEEVLKMYGSNIYIELGEHITLLDLLYGLMLRSGNDAAVVIAKSIGGNEEKFVEMMNKKASEIGMKNTVYNNCHGLDEETENKSTAYDMALLSSYAYKNPIYREIVGTKKYILKTDKKTYEWTNRNKLLFRYNKTTGGKTGYTPSAGRTLVTNASNNNLNLTAVTLNDGNEYISHETMYEYGFQNYKRYLIIDKKRFKIDNAYFKDKIYIKKNFSYPLSEDEKDKILVVVEIEKTSNYKNKDRIGKIIVKLSNKKIFSENVYVKVEKNNSNLLDKIKKKLNK